MTTPGEPTPLYQPPAPPTKRRPWLAPVVVTVAVLVVGALAFLIYADSQAHHDVTTLQHQVSTLQTNQRDAASSITGMGSQISSIDSQVSTIQGNLSNLSRPNDPLSSYNQVCTAQNTNGVTGLIQTFYYPCTNSATPSPSNQGGT